MIRIIGLTTFFSCICARLGFFGNVTLDSSIIKKIENNKDEYNVTCSYGFSSDNIT